MPDKIEKELPKEDKVDTGNKNMRMLTPKDLGVKTENILDKYNKEKNEIMKDVNDNDLKVGIEIEKEHIPTINKIKEYIEKNGGTFPPNELIQEWISLDHIKEHKNYYNDKNGLPAMERKLSEETFNDREHNEASVTAKKVKDENNLIEKLAELEHEQWIEWSKDISKKEKLSPDRLKRWKEYWVDYNKLKEDVKEQDRKYARKVLKIFKEIINNEIKGSNNNNETFTPQQIRDAWANGTTIDFNNKKYVVHKRSDGLIWIEPKTNRERPETQPIPNNALFLEKTQVKNQYNVDMDVYKVEANKMGLKDIEVNGKIYKGLSDGKNIYFNDIDAQELGIGTMEIKAELIEDKVRCNNCMKVYDQNIKQCPECKTDKYLMQPFENEDIEQFKNITCPECGMELQEKTCECGWNIDKEYNGTYDNKGEGE